MKIPFVLYYVEWKDCSCINQHKASISKVPSWQKYWKTEESFPNTDKNQ